MPPVCVKKEDVRLLIKALEQVAAGKPLAKETADEALASFRAKNFLMDQ